MKGSFEADFKQHPFVLHLDPRHLETLLECAQECRFKRGEYLKRQGEPADQIYLIQSGEVTLEISLPHDALLRIETLGSGQVPGWPGLAEPYRWRFDARAVTSVEGFALDTACLRAKYERDPADLGRGGALLQPLNRRQLERLCESASRQLSTHPPFHGF